jgi:hypothetical protein
MKIIASPILLISFPNSVAILWVSLFKGGFPSYCQLRSRRLAHERPADTRTNGGGIADTGTATNGLGCWSIYGCQSNAGVERDIQHCR